MATRLTERTTPYAVAMWDFSWLERRYPGGGYEDPERALDELVDRGYDAVRIDAYPHLLAAGAERTWTLPPNRMRRNDWGAPGTCDVRVWPALHDFVAACDDRDVAVALSTWFRPDDTGARMDVATPTDLGDVWVETLDRLHDAGLGDAVCWVDLCNEFPGWIRGDDLVDRGVTFDSPEAGRWMREAVERVRTAYDHDYTFSVAGDFDGWREAEVDTLDFLELHVWMQSFCEFTDGLGVEDPNADPDAYYDALAARGGERYREDRERWLAALDRGIERATAWSRAAGLPLATTESWAVVHARDWPRLDWAWIREVCEYGVREAVETGRWAAVSTSNFCGPQFAGMWEDADWHRRVTSVVNDGDVPRQP
jgi:hypothetical protein